MKLNVPYIPQGNPSYCVAACLQMVFSYYNIDFFYKSGMIIDVILKNQQRIAEMFGIKFKDPYQKIINNPSNLFDYDDGLVVPRFKYSSDPTVVPFIVSFASLKLFGIDFWK